jgi:hypothetical protein
MSESNVAPQIAQNPILAKLLDRGGAELRVYSGFVGASERQGYVSVYPKLANLTRKFEIRESDIVHAESIPEHFAPFGAVMVWVRADSDVSTHVTTSIREPGQGTGPTIQSGRLDLRLRDFDALAIRDCTSNCECHSQCDCQSRPV